MAALYADERVNTPSAGREDSLPLSGNHIPPPSDEGTPESAEALISPSPHLPLIDLAPALEHNAPGDHLAPATGTCSRHGRADVVSAMLSAAKEWGFFQVVNHGVPVELLERMASLANDFFNLPMEHKARGDTGSSFYSGYSRFGATEGITLTSILAEPSSAEQFANSIWPEGNPAFCETSVEVARELEALRNRILEFLAEGLELPTNSFTRPFEELKAAGQADSAMGIRINFYPPSNESSLNVGLKPHTDPSLIALLYQDTGDALHILSKDESSWHVVEYKRDGIIVFINDILQGWSNGVLQAGIHKAALNSDKSRLSYMLFSNPPLDMVIEPIVLPLNEDGDLRPCYKPFSFLEYYATLGNGYTAYEKGTAKGIDRFFMNKQLH